MKRENHVPRWRLYFWPFWHIHFRLCCSGAAAAAARIHGIYAVLNLQNQNEADLEKDNKVLSPAKWPN